MKKDKIVAIYWDDASYNTGYYDQMCEHDFAPIHNKSVGHLVKSDREKVIISTDMWQEGESRFRHIHTIPKGMITRIVNLSEE